MTRPVRHSPGDLAPVFVDRDTAARLVQISVDTWDSWVRSGFVPRARVQHGRVTRWHWPEVEAQLLATRQPGEIDPYMKGIADAAPRRSRHASR